MDNDLILAYLAVLVSYLVFGIGLLPLADDRPTHIKPISDRYDHISQKTKKWGVIYFLLIQIISLVLYLFDVNALFGWQSFGVIRQFFIRYYNQLSAGMILISSCLIIWLYHQTIFQGKDYKKLIERIRGNKKISFEQKMRDLGRIGFFAESIDIKLEVLGAIKEMVDKGASWSASDVLYITEAIIWTLSDVVKGNQVLFRRSMKILGILSKKITKEETAQKNNFQINKIFTKIQGISKRLKSNFCRLLGVPQNDVSMTFYRPQRFSQKESWEIIKRSVSDIVTFGIETHSLEVKSLLIEEVAQIVGKSNNTDDLEFTITEIKRIAFSSPNESSNPLFTLAIETIVRLIERIDENKNQGKSVGETTTESPWLHNKLLLGRAYKILGSEALLRANDWQAQSLQEYLLNSIVHIPEGLQSETMFEFGLAAHKGDHSDEALRFLDTLHQSELPEHETYWLGLLARLTAGKETGRRWAAATAMVQSSGDDALTMIEDAQKTFILLTDFETADAIEELKPYIAA